MSYLDQDWVQQKLANALMKDHKVFPLSKKQEEREVVICLVAIAVVIIATFVMLALL